MLGLLRGSHVLFGSKIVFHRPVEKESNGALACMDLPPRPEAAFMCGKSRLDTLK